MAAVNDNVIQLIRVLARGRASDPAIAARLGLTVAQVRRARKDNDIPAGERRWLPESTQE